MGFRVAEGLMVKVPDEESIVTENESVSHLKGHLPSFPAPKNHSDWLDLASSTLLFTVFVPGLDLKQICPRLNDDQKHSISTQLEALSSGLRSSPFPENSTISGVAGEGRKDAR